MPEGVGALLLLTVEELAVNELREPCHHWVRTLAFPVRGDALGEELAHRPARNWNAPPTSVDREAARELWEDVEDALKERVRALQAGLTAALAGKMHASGKAVRELEKKRFDHRQRELKRAIGENQLAKLAKEAEKLRAQARQLSLFSESDHGIQKRLADLEAELALRRSHYQQVQERLAAEAERTLKQVLPKRYALRGEARIYPIAVEIRLPGGVR